MTGWNLSLNAPFMGQTGFLLILCFQRGVLLPLVLGCCISAHITGYTWTSGCCWVNVAENAVAACVAFRTTQRLPWQAFSWMKSFLHWSTRICRGQPDLEGAVDASQQMTALLSLSSHTHTHTHCRFCHKNGMYFQHNRQAVVSCADFSPYNI